MAVFMTGATVPKHMNFVTYLESSGTQYIDTGFIPNQNTKVVMEAQLISAGQVYPAPFGTDNTDTNSFYVFFLGGTTWAANFNSSRYSVTGGETDRCVFSLDSSAFVVNSESAQISQGNFQSDYKLFLFCINRGSSVGNKANMKLFSCQIYDNGTLIRDYLPCLDKDGVACLYDKVSETYFYNQGTGEFIAGAAA